MFSAAIFDMDGLLIDSERAIMDAWILAAGRLDVTLSATDYHRVIGTSFPDARAILTDLLGGEAPFDAAISFTRQHLSEQPPSLRFPLKPGVIALLQSLHEARIPCAVASSSSNTEIRQRLAAVGVLRYFSVVASGDEVVRGKPDPAIYQLAAHRLNHGPDRCLAFEDSENGARAAVAAGIKVIVIPDVKHPSTEVADNCFRLLTSLEEAIEYVPSWFDRRVEDDTKHRKIEKPESHPDDY